MTRSSKKSELERKVAILVDYANIAIQASAEKKILDFEKLLEECLQLGTVEDAFVFIPDDWYEIPQINKLGFEIITCQGVKLDSEKLEDRVDIHIIRRAWKLLSNSNITDYVLIGHDKHMLEWVKDVKFKNRKIHIFAGEKLSRMLKEVPGVDLHPLPLKEKRERTF